MKLPEITPKMLALDEAAIAAGAAQRQRIEEDYLARAVHPEEIGTRAGPVHAASILVWVELARRAGVPFIPAETIASIPMELAWRWVDGGETTAEEKALLAKAINYCAADGTFWRTELCAGEAVKGFLGSNGQLPPREWAGFSLDDCRIMDMHWGMPDVKVIGRPLVQPARVKGWPVEFRIFCGGQAETGAASFYYPQAGKFQVTAKLSKAMETAREYALRLYGERDALGLVPWIPDAGEPSHLIGATIDFMLTADGQVVLVDAGPGFGCGAHPCCFVDVPVQGTRWRLAEEGELR